jgi:hypothetical protein
MSQRYFLSVPFVRRSEMVVSAPDNSDSCEVSWRIGNIGSFPFSYPLPRERWVWDFRLEAVSGVEVHLLPHGNRALLDLCPDRDRSPSSLLSFKSKLIILVEFCLSSSFLVCNKPLPSLSNRSYTSEAREYQQWLRFQDLMLQIGLNYYSIGGNG